MRNIFKRNQARVAEKAAREELKRQTEIVCPDCRKATLYYSLATFFLILYRDHGFTKEQLEQLKREYEVEAHLMETGILGKQYNTDQVVNYLKAKIGIDLNESIYGGE